MAGRTRSAFVGTVTSAGDRVWRNKKMTSAVWQDMELNDALWNVWETLAETDCPQFQWRKGKKRETRVWTEVFVCLEFLWATQVA